MSYSVTSSTPYFRWCEYVFTQLCTSVLRCGIGDVYFCATIRWLFCSLSLRPYFSSVWIKIVSTFKSYFFILLWERISFLSSALNLSLFFLSPHIIIYYQCRVFFLVPICIYSLLSSSKMIQIGRTCLPNYGWKPTYVSTLQFYSMSVSQICCKSTRWYYLLLQWALMGYQYDINIKLEINYSVPRYWYK